MSTILSKPMTCPVAHGTPSENPAPSRCPINHQALGSSVPTCPVSARAAEFDPFDNGYQQDPPDYVRWAREQEPVFYSPKIGYWVLTRYDDIKAVFRDNITFSPSNALEKITPTSDEANAVLASYNYGMSRTLVNEDEPAHMPRRRLLMEPFTPEALIHHEPMVRRLTREYVDRFINDGKADLVDQMLWEVPLTVALHFLGVPEEDMDKLRQYSIAHTVNTWGRPRPDEQVAVAHAVGNFWQLAGRILEKMRRNPSGAGWMQYGLRKQQEHPEIVTDSYLHSMMMAGIVAAHETTANATANAVKLLLQHPQAWQDICRNPGLIANAVEECLRHNGSVAAWRRRVTKDVNIGGVDIPEGARLLIVTSSANHDDRHFMDADFFDIHREKADEHLTFGYGLHQCMGKNLARMEMQVFLEELTRRLPHMRLSAQTFSYVPNTSFRGPEHLLVEWDPAQNPERADAQVLERSTPVSMGVQGKKAAARTLRVDRVSVAADGILKIRLVTPDGRALPRWTAGSHIDIECGEPSITRQYSLCGNPEERHAFEIAVLHEKGGRGGSDWIHTHVREGGLLNVRGPRNHFKLDETADRLVLIAGGIGITPIAAMARRAQALGIDYVVHYCGRSRRTMALLDEMAALHGDKLHVHASEGGDRLDIEGLLAQPQAGVRIYACGPQRLLNALSKATCSWPTDTLRVEHFTSTVSLLDPEKEHVFQVELKNSGVRLDVPRDQTLLAVLRQARIDVQSDCEEGLCGSCEVQVLAGEVDHRDMVLTDSERRSQQKMMVCCSRARGSRLVLDL